MEGLGDIPHDVRFCAETYLNENDLRFAINQPTLSNSFVPQVTHILEDVAIAWSPVLIEKARQFIASFKKKKEVEFEEVKEEEKKREEKKKTDSKRIPIRIFGQGPSGKTPVLHFMDTRPFFKLGPDVRFYFKNVQFVKDAPTNVKQYTLSVPLYIPPSVDCILENVTLAYSGSLGKFIAEEEAPSVFILGSTEVPRD